MMLHYSAYFSDVDVDYHSALSPSISRERQSEYEDKHTLSFFENEYIYTPKRVDGISVSWSNILKTVPGYLYQRTIYDQKAAWNMCIKELYTRKPGYTCITVSKNTYI